MPKKNGKTTVDEQNSYFSHLSGKQAVRKTGEAKFDPESSESRGVIEIKSARGSDLDTILLVATAQRSDITHLAQLYQRKIQINISTQLKILEKKRAASQAAVFYHRPNLIKSHNEDAKKNIEQRSESGLGYEDSLRSVLYDINLMDGVTKDEVAIAVANHFKYEMKKATESDNPLDNLIVATQMARYEEALRVKYVDDDSEEVEWIEEGGCTFVKDPETGKPREGEYGQKTQITDWNMDVERDEDGEITKVTENNHSSPERNKEGVEEAQEKIYDEKVIGCGGIPAEGGDILANGENESGSQESEWDREKVEKSIAETMDAYGSTAATGASTQETRGFKAEGDSARKETTQETLDRIRADMAIKAEEVATINASGLYGVHTNDITVLRANQLEPLVKSAPINLLLNQTRDIRGQAYARVGNPSSKTWRTRLGDMQVFKRPPDTLGDVVVMTDMSGSMGCGCQKCFSYEETAAITCSMVNMHAGRDSDQPLIHSFPYEGNTGVRRYSHISNGDGTATCIVPNPADIIKDRWSNGALAREVVTAISNRFSNQTKVFGFSSGGYRTGAKIAEFPKGLYPNHRGYEEFGGGTPTCSAMDYMNDLLAGSMSRTAGVFIADGTPGSGGMMKDLPIKNCDSMHYRHLAESFAKRGMRFGVVSVGYMQFPTDIPNAKTAWIKSTDDLAQLAPLFNHLAGR